jgi:tetratricopeptide (TPR) repeat protein
MAATVGSQAGHPDVRNASRGRRRASGQKGVISRLPFSGLAGRCPAFMDSEKQNSEAVFKFLGWLEVNKKRVAIGGAAGLAALGLIATLMWFSKQKEFTASEALASIRIPYHPSDPVPPDTADKLQKLAAEYPGTDAAKRAQLIRGGLLYTDGKYAEAQAVFEKFMRDYQESPWIPQAFYCDAVCLDAQNKIPDAIAKYEDFGRRYPNDPLADQARLNLASLYEASNKPADALKEYEKITKAMAQTPALQEAQEKQRALLTKHPELMPTNAPVLRPTPPTLSSTGQVMTIRSNPPAGTNVPLVIRSNLPPMAQTNLPPRTPPALPLATNPPVKPK